ncbi:histidine kinase, partial [Pseudomonas syringae pv. tagetis]
MLRIEKLFDDLHSLQSITKVAKDLKLKYANTTSSLERNARNIE